MSLPSWLRCGLLLASVCLSTGALAQTRPVTCSTTSISDVAFGPVDSLSGLVADTSATISFSCSNQNNQDYAGSVCFNITDGVVGARSLQDASAHTLSYQLYTDVGHTVAWGGTAASAVIAHVTVPRASSGWTSTATIYGEVAAGQTSAVAADYLASFLGTQTTIAVNVVKAGAPADCSGASATSTGRSFKATATVTKKCIVQASALDFGSWSSRTLTNADNAVAMSTQCTASVPYQIGLDNGSHASGTTRRMSDGGSEVLAYELYLDSARTRRWGNTLNVDTMSLTGTGLSQASTVYGRVPAQTLAAPGQYTDTVTITVTY